MVNGRSVNESSGRRIAPTEAQQLTFYFVVLHCLGREAEFFLTKDIFYCVWPLLYGKANSSR